MDWIGMALAKHKDSKLIRDAAGSYVDLASQDEGSSWEVKVWKKEDIIVDKNVETVNKNVMELHKPSIIENDKKEQYAEEIKKKTGLEL